jgi:hypothetical protein
LRQPPPLQPGEPEQRPSAPTLAHAVPPIPDNLAGVAGRLSSTAIELDAAAKAKAHAQAASAAEPAQAAGHGIEATERGTLDPRLGGRGSQRHIELQPEIGDSTSTSTGVSIGAASDDDEAGTSVGPVPGEAANARDDRADDHDARDDGDDDSGDETNVTTAPAPPAPSASQRIITDHSRALSTSQRSVARAPTEDPFETGRVEALSPPDGELVDEANSVTQVGVVAEDGGKLTDVHDIPDVDALMGDVPSGTLSAELAAQSVSGSIGEETDATRRADELFDNYAQQTPIPRLSTVSTASSSLPPPKATQDSASGPTPACPQCESPMAWVDEHLRFYCKQCRMYF